MLAWAETPWRAWMELTGERPFVSTGYAVPMGGMKIMAQPLPIPWSAIVAWCGVMGCSVEERTEFVVPLVMAMDREYLAHWARQQNRPEQQPVNDKLARWEQMETADG